RGKRHLGLRCGADLTVLLSTNGCGAAHGTSPLTTWIHWDAAGAKVRSLHSPKRDHAAVPRGTTDVGAFLRTHPNGRAKTTNDGSVSSTHCVSPLLLQTAPATKLLPVVQLRSGVILLMGVEPLPDIRDGILVERLVKTLRYVADMRRCQYVVQRPEGVRRRQRL